MQRPVFRIKYRKIPGMSHLFVTFLAKMDPATSLLLASKPGAVGVADDKPAGINGISSRVWRGKFFSDDGADFLVQS